VIVVQHHAKASVRKHLVDDAFDGKQFLFGHSLLAERGRQDAALIPTTVAGDNAQADKS
jgi:hypothetical protein